MEKVKEVKREGCRRAEHRGREPLRTEELNVMRDYVGVTMAVSDDDAMDSVQVEDHVVVELRRTGTWFTWAMTELDYVAEGGEGHRLEERTIPPLVYWLVTRGYI